MLVAGWGCIRPNYHDLNPRNFKPLVVVKRLASIPRNPLKNNGSVRRDPDSISFSCNFLGQFYYYNNNITYSTTTKQTKVTK